MWNGAVQWARNFEMPSLYRDPAPSVSSTITKEFKMWVETVQQAKLVKSKLYIRHIPPKTTTKVFVEMMN